MREAEFRRFLIGRLGARSIDSYVAYCRRVESELAVDLDRCGLRPEEIRDLTQRLRAAGAADKSASNCGSALRAYVSLLGSEETSDHQAIAETTAKLPHHRDDGMSGMPKVGIDAAPMDGPMAKATVKELLTTYGDVMAELRRRGVIRTGNAPVGDYAELLFSKAFDWRLEGNSAVGYDAVDTQGWRYQIKGRLLAHDRASRQLSAIRKIDDQAFDYLAAVLFDPGFGIRRAAVLPHALVRARARKSEHTNSWIFYLDDRVLAAEGVRDVTDALTAMANQVK
ncbi:hypothetical protein [Methylobacterium sp. D54C]